MDKKPLAPTPPKETREPPRRKLLRPRSQRPLKPFTTRIPALRFGARTQSLPNCDALGPGVPSTSKVMGYGSGAKRPAAVKRVLSSPSSFEWFGLNLEKPESATASTSKCGPDGEKPQALTTVFFGESAPESSDTPESFGETPPASSGETTPEEDSPSKGTAPDKNFPNALN